MVVVGAGTPESLGNLEGAENRVSASEWLLAQRGIPEAVESSEGRRFVVRKEQRCSVEDLAEAQLDA